MSYKKEIQTSINENELIRKIINKITFSRMTIYFAVQLLSSSVVTMLRKATNDSSIHPNLRLKQNQYDKIIEMAEKVDKLVDICNGRSKEKGKYTLYFTTENGHKIQNKLLNILD